MNAGRRIVITLVLMLLFVAALVTGFHVIAYEKDAGKISPHVFAVLVLVPMLIFVLAALLFFRSKWARNLIAPLDNSGGNSKRDVQLLIWLARFAIVALVILFLNGLLHIQEKPLAPRLVGLVMNLLFTFAIVIAVKRLQNQGSK